MCTEFGSHLEKSLSARFPLIVDKIERYVSRLTTRKSPRRRQNAATWAFSFEPIGRSSREAILTHILPLFVHGGGFFAKLPWLIVSASSRTKCLNLIGSRPRVTKRTPKPAPEGALTPQFAPKARHPQATAKEIAGARPAFSLRPWTESQYLTANSRRRRGLRRRCATARGMYRWSR